MDKRQRAELGATKSWREWAADASIDFWDCIPDNEALDHEALEEAVAHYLDNGVVVDAADDFETSIRQHCPKGLTVYGFRRKAVDAAWLKGRAELLAESFMEEWADEYGNAFEPPDRAEEANIATSVLGALEDALPTPRQCERAVDVVIPLDELLSALREWPEDLRVREFPR